MGLFVCEKCGTLENTALGRWWSKDAPSAPEKGKALCCVCMPETYDDGSTDINAGKWHGLFPQRPATADDDVINPESLP